MELSQDELYRMFEELYQRLKKQHGDAVMNRWIDGEEVMNMLRITSKTTLQKLRNEGKARFSCRSVSRDCLYLGYCLGNF